MTKKRRKKTKIDYWGDDQTEAIINFKYSDDAIERDKIFREHLHKPMTIMIESIPRVYSNNFNFGGVPLEELEVDLFSHLISVVHKYDEKKVDLNRRYDYDVDTPTELLLDIPYTHNDSGGTTFDDNIFAGTKIKYTGDTGVGKTFVQEVEMISKKPHKLKFDLIEYTATTSNEKGTKGRCHIKITKDVEGYGYKTYSYCQAIIKYYLNDMSKKNVANQQKFMDYDLYMEDIDSREDNLYFMEEPDSVGDEYEELMAGIIKGIEKEIQTNFSIPMYIKIVGEALVYVLKNWHTLFAEETNAISKNKTTMKFQKSKVKTYISEYTRFDNKKIVEGLKHFQNLYQIFKGDFLDEQNE